MNTPFSRSSNLIATMALAICVAGLVGVDATAQPRGKLGTAEVAVQQSGGNLVVLYQGREFAKFAAPSGRQRTLYCCTANKCTPIGSSPALACDIVVYCTGQDCAPQ